MRMDKIARLVAVPKPNGKPRPIWIGESLHRFALGTLHFKLKSRFQALFESNQFGLSLDGTTLAVNELAAYLTNNPESIMLVPDFKNAFNSLYRRQIRAALRDKMASLLPLFEGFYSHDNHVACWAMGGR